MSNKQEYLIEINGDASKLEAAINQANGKLQLLQGHKYKVSMDIDMDKSAYDKFIKQVNNKKLKVQIQYDRTKSAINTQKGILNDANLFNKSFSNGLKSSNIDSIIKNRIYSIKKDISNGIYDTTKDEDRKQIQDRLSNVSDIISAAKIKSKGSYKLPEDINKQLNQMLATNNLQDYKGNIFKYNKTVRNAQTLLKENQQHLNDILSGTTLGVNNSKFIDKTGKTTIDMTQKVLQNRINAKAKQIIDQAVNTEVKQTAVPPSNQKDRNKQLESLYSYFDKYGINPSASNINRVDKLKNILKNSIYGDYSYFDEQAQVISRQFDNQITSYYQKNIEKYRNYAKSQLDSNRYTGNAKSALTNLSNSISDLDKFKNNNTNLYDFSSDQAVAELQKYRNAIRETEEECSKAANVLSDPLSNSKLSTQINSFINNNKKLSSSFVSDLKNIDSQLNGSTTQQDLNNYLLKFQEIKQQTAKINNNYSRIPTGTSIHKDRDQQLKSMYSYFDRYGIKTSASTINRVDKLKNILENSIDGDYSYFDEQAQLLSRQFDNQVTSYYQKNIAKYRNYAESKLGSKRYIGSAESSLNKLNESITNLDKFKDSNTGLYNFNSDEAVAELKKFRDAVKETEQECSKASNVLSNPISNAKLSTQINDFINRNKKLSSGLVSDLKEIDKQLGKSTTQQDLQNYLIKFQEIKQQADKLGMIGGNTLRDQISDSLKNSTANLIANFFSYQDLMRYGQQIAAIVTEINSAQTELQKVSDASNKRIQENFTTSAQTAQKLGATVSDVITDTADWSRLNVYRVQ